MTGKLTVGSRVIIRRSSGYYGISPANPDDTVRGTIILIEDDDTHWGGIEVHWDNGNDNTYGSDDLELVGNNALTKRITEGLRL